MADWTSHVSKAQARAILDAKIKTRFSAPDASGIWRTRYTALTASERTSLEAIANG
jgi:hypothetical protein